MDVHDFQTPTGVHDPVFYGMDIQNIPTERQTSKAAGAKSNTWKSEVETALKSSKPAVSMQ